MRGVLKIVKKIKLFSIFHEGVVIILTLLRIKNYCALVTGITFELNAFSQENESLLRGMRSRMITNVRFLAGAINY